MRGLDAERVSKELLRRESKISMIDTKAGLFQTLLAFGPNPTNFEMML